MFGKPIAQVELSDLERLGFNRIPEGRHLEFKEAVPVSKDEANKHRREQLGGVPCDRKVAEGKGIADHGRNELLEELVAFANADGGVIVLGISETRERPPRASDVTPIPHAERLKQTLLNAITDCIEPRLPYVSVEVIPVGEDGAGVILLETQASALGPHRVRQSRNATIRRADSCQKMDMPEIHDMVLRKSRRFEDVARKLEKAQADFEQHFWTTLALRRPQEFNVADMRVGMAQWSAANVLQLVGMRVTIVPHQALGLDRLEDVNKLQPNGNIKFLQGEAPQQHPLLNPLFLQPRRRLGGVEIKSEAPSGPISLIHDLYRDGFVEIRSIRADHASTAVHVVRFLACVGSALGFFHKLRKHGGAPNLPAEVGVEVLAVGNARPMVGWDTDATYGAPLEFRTLFPASTVSAKADFDELLNGVAGDFWNAGNGLVSRLPHFSIEFD